MIPILMISRSFLSLFSHLGLRLGSLRIHFWVTCVDLWLTLARFRKTLTKVLLDLRKVLLDLPSPPGSVSRWPSGLDFGTTFGTTFGSLVSICG